MQLNNIEQAGDKGFASLMTLLDLWLRKLVENGEEELAAHLKQNVKDVYYQKAEYSLVQDQIDNIIKTIPNDKARRELIEISKQLSGGYGACLNNIDELKGKALASNLGYSAKDEFVKICETLRKKNGKSELDTDENGEVRMTEVIDMIRASENLSDEDKEKLTNLCLNNIEGFRDKALANLGKESKDVFLSLCSELDKKNADIRENMNKVIETIEGAKTLDDGQKKELEDFFYGFNAAGTQCIRGIRELEDYIMYSPDIDENTKTRYIALFEDCRLSLYDPYGNCMPSNVYDAFVQILHRPGNQPILDGITFLRASNGDYIAQYPKSMAKDVEPLLYAAALQCGKYQHITKEDLETIIAARVGNKMLASELRFEDVPAEIAEKAIEEADKQGIVTFVKENPHEKEDDPVLKVIHTKNGDKNIKQQYYTLICYAGERDAERTAIYSEAQRILACTAFLMTGPGSDLEAKRMRHSINRWNDIDNGINDAEKNGEKRGVIVSASYDKKKERISEHTIIKFNAKEARASYNNDGTVTKNLSRSKETDSHSEEEWKYILNVNSRVGDGTKFYLNDAEWKKVVESPAKIRDILAKNPTAEAEKNRADTLSKTNKEESFYHLAAFYILSDNKQTVTNGDCQTAYLDAVAKSKSFNDMSNGRETYDKNQANAKMIFAVTDQMGKEGKLAYENPWSVRADDADRTDRPMREAVNTLRTIAKNPEYLTDYLKKLYEDAGKKGTPEALESATKDEKYLTDDISKKISEAFHKEGNLSVTDMKIEHVISDTEKSAPEKLSILEDIAMSLPEEKQQDMMEKIEKLGNDMRETLTSHVEDAEVKLGGIRVAEKNLHLEPSVLIENTRSSEKSRERAEAYLEEAGLGFGNPVENAKAHGIDLGKPEPEKTPEDESTFAKENANEMAY